MELTNLRYFTAVARELHFRRAAALLHITQAPLSAAIRKLEDELGVRLFERTSRSVRLTPAGEFFLPEAEAVLHRAALARKRLEEMLRQTLGKLTIGYNEPALNSFLPQVLARYRGKQPDLPLELREMETAEQLALLRRGALDIGLMRPVESDLTDLASKLIFRESYRLAMPPGHPLARYDAIPGEALAGREIILFAREVNPAVYDRLTVALTVDPAHPPRFRQDARNKNSMLIMARAGFGAALLPAACCGQSQAELVNRPLLLNLPPVDIMAVWDPDNITPALRNFIAVLPELDGTGAS